MKVQKNSYGVLLLNMGGPSSLDEVEDYIYQLLADPDMIRMPLGFLLQKPFARMVAGRRSPKVRERYTLIGGRSPIGEETARQTELLKTKLNLPVEFAMRYTSPSVSKAVSNFEDAGVTRVIAIPLYPQYSTVSTLSSIKDLDRQSSGSVEHRVLDRHFNDRGYIAAMTAALKDTLDRTEPDRRTHLLFAAHSIPESYIAQGDPYADEVEQTMALILDELNLDLPASLAYQSRVGPVKWRGPTLDEELVKLVENGIQQVVVQPLSFVSENLETMFDLDIDFRESCRKSGDITLHRVPTLGCSPLYIEALAGMAHQAIDHWEVGNA